MRKKQAIGSDERLRRASLTAARVVLAVVLLVGMAVLVAGPTRKTRTRTLPALFRDGGTGSLTGTGGLRSARGGGSQEIVATNPASSPPPPPPGMDFWWMAALRSNPDAAVSLAFESPRLLAFPSETRRVWIDVGVNKRSDFIVNLDQPGGKDLFVLGYEPSSVWKPCPHDRCVVLWAAATPSYNVIEVNVQDGGDLCNSILKPNTGTKSELWRGCVTQKADSNGRPVTVQAPGIPLSEVVSRIPENVQVEYVKIDAQGYDLEVMKGALQSSDRIQVVSLEAMDVTDRSKLLYQGQPTLSDIQQVLGDAGWKFVRAVSNRGALGEVNAFFVYRDEYAHKVGHLADVLMGNKEGMGEQR